MTPADQIDWTEYQLAGIQLDEDVPIPTTTSSFSSALLGSIVYGSANPTTSNGNITISGGTFTISGTGYTSTVYTTGASNINNITITYYQFPEPKLKSFEGVVDGRLEINE